MNVHVLEFLNGTNFAKTFYMCFFVKNVVLNPSFHFIIFN